MGAGEQPSAPKRSSPSFSCTSCFVCVSHGAVVMGTGLQGCVGQVRAVPGACHCPVTSQHLAALVPLHGRVLDNHREVGRDPKGHLSHCTGHICRADAQLAAPGRAGRAHPHFLTSLCPHTMYPLCIPAIPVTHPVLLQEIP